MDKQVSKPVLSIKKEIAIFHWRKLYFLVDWAANTSNLYAKTNGTPRPPPFGRIHDKIWHIWPYEKSLGCKKSPFGHERKLSQILAVKNYSVTWPWSCCRFELIVMDSVPYKYYTVLFCFKKLMIQYLLCSMPDLHIKIGDKNVVLWWPKINCCIFFSAAFTAPHVMSAVPSNDVITSEGVIRAANVTGTVTFLTACITTLVTNCIYLALHLVTDPQKLSIVVPQPQQVVMVTGQQPVVSLGTIINPTNVSLSRSKSRNFVLPIIYPVLRG